MSIANFLSSAAKTGSALAGAINPYMQIGSAAAGLFGSIFGGKSSAEKQNEANIKFQREENAKNRDFALQQMNRQELFNTTAANTAWERALNMYQRQRDDNSLYAQAQQARRAGINPFGIFGNGAFNGASAPSVPVASSPSAPSANGVAPQYSFLEPAKYDKFLSKFSAVAEAINSLAGASNNNASSQSTREKLASELELLMHQSSTEEARSQIEANRAALDTYFGFAERETALKSANKSIENLEKEIVLKGKDIDQKDFELSCNEIRRKILNQEERLGYFKVQTAIFNFDHLAESWQADINLKRSQSAAASASAEQSHESAVDIRATRNLRLKILDLEKELDANENAFEKQTFQDRLDQFMNETEKQGIVIDDLREQLELARKNNDWYAYHQILGGLRDVLVGAAAGATLGARSKGSPRLRGKNVETYKSPHGNSRQETYFYDD